MGRLFDAAAALAGVRQTVNYEAQAAVEFEALADPQETGAYNFEIHPRAGILELDPLPLLEALSADALSGLPLPKISARFHNGLARLVLDVCLRLRQDSGVSAVALSGGVWQNLTLLGKTCHLLAADHFKLYLHHQMPANDGGLALGQAAVGAFALFGQSGGFISAADRRPSIETASPAVFSGKTS
jgi:hydrogenase maturation protein HypF